MLVLFVLALCSSACARARVIAHPGYPDAPTTPIVRWRASKQVVPPTLKTILLPLLESLRCGLVNRSVATAEACRRHVDACTSTMTTHRPVLSSLLGARDIAVACAHARHAIGVALVGATGVHEGSRRVASRTRDVLTSQPSLDPEWESLFRSARALNLECREACQAPAVAVAAAMVCLASLVDSSRQLRAAAERGVFQSEGRDVLARAAQGLAAGAVCGSLAMVASAASAGLAALELAARGGKAAAAHFAKTLAGAASFGGVASLSQMEARGAAGAARGSSSLHGPFQDEGEGDGTRARIGNG